jgi:hypothetical protein
MMAGLHVLVSDVGKNHPKEFADMRPLGKSRLLMPYHEFFVDNLKVRWN